MLIVGWLLVLGALTWFFQGYEEQRYNPNQQPESSTGEGFREVHLQQNPMNHYVSSGRINNHPVVFMLDTGATDVVIPAAVAEHIGLKKGMRGRAQTANGIVDIYHTRVKHLQIGNIELRDISASINPAMSANEEILLGMSALKELEFVQRGESLILRQYTY